MTGRFLYIASNGKISLLICGPKNFAMSLQMVLKVTVRHPSTNFYKWNNPDVYRETLCRVLTGIDGVLYQFELIWVDSVE